MLRIADAGVLPRPAKGAREASAAFDESEIKTVRHETGLAARGPRGPGSLGPALVGQRCTG